MSELAKMIADRLMFNRERPEDRGIIYADSTPVTFFRPRTNNSQEITMSAEILELHDIVRIGNGDRIIITAFNHNRPANKYSGVLEKGMGKEYIFGHKHRPVYVGHADHDHPALVALRNRKADRAETVAASAGVAIMNSTTKAIIANLVANAEGVLSLLEAEGRDTGVGGPLSDLRDSIIAAKVGGLLS